MNEEEKERMIGKINEVSEQIYKNTKRSDNPIMLLAVYWCECGYAKRSVAGTHAGRCLCCGGLF